MSQEATVILMDNSNYMRNGDLIPDRFQAEKDALYYLCNNKRRQNIENTCGVVTLSKSEVVCTLTSDPGKLMNRVRNVKMEEDASFRRGISIAHLVLRNRLYRNQKPRIIAFVGSPITDSNEELTKMAKKLKKEKVNVTVVNFGEVNVNEKLLTEFVDQLNKSANPNDQSERSIVINIPSDSFGIQEYLNTHPSITGTVVQAGSLNPVIQQNNVPMIPGFDDEDDPDLAYALRISLDDQRIRQENALNQAERANKNASSPEGHQMSVPPIKEPTPSDEEILLNQLLMMTQMQDEPKQLNQSIETPKKKQLEKTEKPHKTSKIKLNTIPQKPNDNQDTSGPASQDQFQQQASVMPAHLQFMSEQEQIAYAVSMSITTPNVEDSNASKGKSDRPPNQNHQHKRDKVSPSEEPKKKKRRGRKKEEEERDEHQQQ